MLFVFGGSLLRANPVGTFACPDPGVLKVGSMYYVGQTGGSNGAMPIHWTSDITNWSASTYSFVFPNSNMSVWPAWRLSSTPFWAPALAYSGGRYLSYFACKAASSGLFCIGAAVSSVPNGPYQDIGAPVAVNATYGLIDPYYFLDPVTGRRYLLWKEDRNAVGQRARIIIQELASDDVTLIGSASLMLTAAGSGWEGNVVEAPALIRRNNEFFLFYSGNIYSKAAYATGVARSTTISGTYTKRSTNPILQQDTNFGGTGGASLTTDGYGRDLVMYHAYRKDSSGNIYGSRLPMIASIQWDASGWPNIAGYTSSVEDWKAY